MYVLYMYAWHLTVLGYTITWGGYLYYPPKQQEGVVSFSDTPRISRRLVSEKSSRGAASMNRPVHTVQAKPNVSYPVFGHYTHNCCSTPRLGLVL